VRRRHAGPRRVCSPGAGVAHDVCVLLRSLQPDADGVPWWVPWRHNHVTNAIEPPRVPILLASSDRGPEATAVGVKAFVHFCDPRRGRRCLCT
jgi:hypothetical protein